MSNNQNAVSGSTGPRDDWIFQYPNAAHPRRIADDGTERARSRAPARNTRSAVESPTFAPYCTIRQYPRAPHASTTTRRVRKPHAPMVERRSLTYTANSNTRAMRIAPSRQSLPSAPPRYPALEGGTAIKTAPTTSSTKADIQTDICHVPSSPLILGEMKPSRRTMRGKRDAAIRNAITAVSPRVRADSLSSLADDTATAPDLAYEFNSRLSDTPSFRKPRYRYVATVLSETPITEAIEAVDSSESMRASTSDSRELRRSVRSPTRRGTGKVEACSADAAPCAAYLSINTEAASAHGAAAYHSGHGVPMGNP